MKHPKRKTVRLHGSWLRTLKVHGYSHTEAVSVARLANEKRLGAKDTSKVLALGRVWRTGRRT